MKISPSKLGGIQDYVIFHNSKVVRARRAHLNGHRAFNLWFTGLSGFGKFMLAHVEERLHVTGHRTRVFDGDNVQRGFCRDMRFSLEDLVKTWSGS